MNTRIYYLDSLKVLAIFAVVLLHAASTPLYTMSPDTVVFGYANLLDSFARFCVPVFFMASGAAILSRDYDTFDFYRKRLYRIIPAFAFWGAVYLGYRIFVLGEDISPLKAVLAVLSGHIYYHLWFLYVIVILYILSPFIRRLVVSIGREEGFVLLFVWVFISVLLPHAEALTGQKIGFSYRELGSYCGYFMLGFYLSRIRFSRPLVALTLYILSSVFIYLLTADFSLQKGEFVSLFYEYSSPLVLIQSVAMFLLFSSIQNSKIHSYAAHLSGLVFGVYLVHPLILEHSKFIGDLSLKGIFVFASSLLAVKIMCMIGLKKVL